MKIFISWSGSRSEALAKILKEWLPLVLHYVDPWLSNSNIEAGERWSLKLTKELDTCNLGIICITKDNINSPWILFEAGALAKSMEEGRVIPLLLDLDFKEISGPLAQFQAKKIDNNGIKDLVQSLNKVAATPVPESRVTELFDALWDKLEAKLAAMPASATPAKKSRPEGEILEELVASIRTVESRIRDVIEDDVGLRRRRRSRHHPLELMEISRNIGDGPRDPVRLLILAGLFRDDAPWVYELALDAYRAIRGRHKEEAQRAYQRLLSAAELFARGPFSKELGSEREAFYLLLREEFPLFIDEIDRTVDAAPNLTRRERLSTKS